MSRRTVPSTPARQEATVRRAHERDLARVEAFSDGVFAFALTFSLVGIRSADHRLMFEHFVRTSHFLVLLNLLVLMSVVFLPVPTAALGAWVASERNRLTAVLFYGGTWLVAGIILNLLWWYGAYWGCLTATEFTAHQRVHAGPGGRGQLQRGYYPRAGLRRNHPPGDPAVGRGLEAGQALAYQPRAAVRPNKRRRDRLIGRVQRHPDWVLGFQDEVW